VKRPEGFQQILVFTTIAAGSGFTQDTQVNEDKIETYLFEHEHRLLKTDGVADSTICIEAGSDRLVDGFVPAGYEYIFHCSFSRSG
jgi:hypothetical protein